MTPFILAATALAAVALLLLLRPWWARSASRRAAGADTQRALNTAIYKDQLAEIERDRASGQLAESDYTSARDELQRRLLEDTANAAAAASDTGGRGTWIGLALAIPLAAVGLYSQIGKPEAVLTQVEQTARASASIESMVAKLEQRLAAEPDNPQGWAMLGRSYAVMGRWDDAVRAYERIGPALEREPDLQASLAEILVQRAQGDFDGRPRELIAKVLTRQPQHPQALWLAGTDAAQQGRYDRAIGYWQPLLTQVEPGSEDAQMIQEAIDTAKSRLGPAAMAKAGPPPKVSPGGTAASGAGAIEGTVDISPALRAKLKPDDVVFIFARAVNGPRMPLAALRLTAAELPKQFSLSDANAMAGAKISEAGDVRVEAKVSKSGNPITSSGDLLGQSAPVRAGARGIKIVIDKEAP